MTSTLKLNNFSSQNLWLNINKPIGFSSAKVVAIVKKITGAKKVGHGGTLDPFASGVLPIALNKATKTCDYIMDAPKKYYFTITWGEFRDSDDITGSIVESSLARPKNNSIISVLPLFIGKISQTPSRFSAIKIDGERAYNLARQGIEFEMKTREITIHSLKLISNSDTIAEFEVECSKGTYIRSLARDICKRLTVCGYVSKLTRLTVGKFLYNNTIFLDLLKHAVTYNACFKDGSLLSLRNVLDFMMALELDDLDSFKFRNGQIIKTPYKSKYPEVVQVINHNQIIGLARVENDLLKPINVF